MLKKWFRIVEVELNKLIKEVAPFKYGSIIGLLIQLTGLMFILGGIYYFYAEERVTYFARLSSIFIGLIMSIIGKVINAIMEKESNFRLVASRLFAGILDSLLWASVALAIFYQIFNKALKFEYENLVISEIIVFIGIVVLSILTSFILYKKGLSNKALVLYISIVAIPFRIVFIFVKKEYRLFVTVVIVASMLLLTMILLSFQVGELVAIVSPFKSLNVYYPMMVLFMLLSDKLVTYIVPKTSLSKYFGHKDDLAKIFMTWGMIVAMAALYMFDWAVLMQGVIGWDNNDKNIVLWAFTTYELISTMLDDKFNLLKKDK